MKSLDIGPRTINIWNTSEGYLWGQLVLRDVTTFATSSDGSYLITGKSKFNHTSATLEKWDLDEPQETVAYVDEFAEQRRIEFDELFATWHRDNVPSIAEGKTVRKKRLSDKVDLPAPLVDSQDFTKVQLGMSYPEVMDVLLGHGSFQAELASDEEGNPIVRAHVTYQSIDQNRSPYRLEFEANVSQQPYELKLVSKGN